MEQLPDDLLEMFLKGKHVMRHNPGIWNVIWSDMYIESTFMRYGHESGGLAGLTLQPSAVARWALSLHICSQLRGDLVAMKVGQENKIVTTHKEETQSRLASDSSDRQKIQNALQSYIDPLATDTHPPGLLNIVTGLHTTDKVNVDEAVKIGRQQLVEFESGWPKSFNKTLSKKVITMASIKNNIKLDGKQVYRWMCHAMDCTLADRYIKTSTKQMTRSSRSGNDASRKHQLNLHTTLPTQKVVLTVTYNKEQLIDLICQYLVNHIVINQTKLGITGKDPTPVQVWINGTVQRQDLRTHHEESDAIIIHHLVHIASATNDDAHIKVICDDTDVFVLLILFYIKEKMTANISMESPCAGRMIVDIRQTSLKYKNIAKYLPAVHALTGCDTVSYLFGIGKTTALKALMGGHHLSLLGQLGAAEASLISETTTFIAACYGSKVEGDMTTHRYQLWKSKMGNTKTTSAPKLKSLPPSHNAFVQHVHRAQYQAIIWESATQSDPPDLDPNQYGWHKDEDGTTLSPTTLPPGVYVVPINILQMVKCGCSASQPCSTGRCGCVGAHMSCSMFCD